MYKYISKINWQNPQPSCLGCSARRIVAIVYSLHVSANEVQMRASFKLVRNSAVRARLGTLRPSGKSVPLVVRASGKVRSERFCKELDRLGQMWWQFAFMRHYGGDECGAGLPGWSALPDSGYLRLQLCELNELGVTFNAVFSIWPWNQ
jgi:hypothetical protein